MTAPGVLVVGFAFRDGGFFPDATAIGTLVVLAFLLVRVTLDPGAFARQPRIAAATVLAAALLAVWTLLSSSWSDTVSRALLEYGRLLLYATLLVLFISVGRGENRARVFVIAMALGCAVVGIAALGPWLLPNDFPVSAAFRRGRLNWPTSYWNATGLIAAFGTVLGVHLACCVREHPVVRVLGAAVVPPLVAAVIFSGSRGAVAAGALGVAALLLTAPSRGMFTGLPVVLATGAWAAAEAAGVSGLDATQPSAAALNAGRDTAWVLGVLAMAAGLARAGLVWVDGRAARARLPTVRRGHAWGAVAVVVLLAASVSVPAGAPARLSDAWERFTSAEGVGAAEQAGGRFTQLGNNGRIDVWEIAWKKGLRAEPLHGTGAGTFNLLWEHDRPTTQKVIDGHSLELETLAELGIVGLMLLLAAIVPMIGALWWRAVHDQAPAWAALAAVATAWAARSAVDWDWEMPAVTAWLFAAGGLALGRPPVAPARRRAAAVGRTRTLGILAGLGCIALALVPVSIARSQVALIESQRALRAGNCGQAVQHALTATRALSARPESFELLAWCDVRLGRTDLALRAADAAVRRDPGNWELRYTQALVRAVAGEDPRSAARAALQRNPLDPRAQDIARRFTVKNRRSWRRLALEAPLPLGP